MLPWNFKYCSVQIEKVCYWLTVKQTLPNHVPLCETCVSLLAWVYPQLNLVWEPGNDKQSIYFVFIIKTRHKSVFCDNGKITRKEISKLFSCDYPASRRNIEKRLINTENVRQHQWLLETLLIAYDGSDD